MQNTAYGIATHATSNLNLNPNNNVAIKASSGITVGNKNVFTGPIVIKQFITDDENPKKN